MPHRIRITAGSVRALATLDDSKTGQAIAARLPIEATAETWGDEIYFTIPLALAPEDARATVAPGDLAYWPPGRAFCLFFGPTPASHGDEIRPASPVNVCGRLAGNATAFRAVRPGAAVRIERVEMAEPERRPGP